MAGKFDDDCQCGVSFKIDYKAILTAGMQLNQFKIGRKCAGRFKLILKEEQPKVQGKIKIDQINTLLVPGNLFINERTLKTEI